MVCRGDALDRRWLAALAAGPPGRRAAGPPGSLRAGEPSAAPEPPLAVTAGPLKFSERRLLHGYTYAYGISAADLNGDGNPDLTSADAEPNSNLYLLLGDGRGGFRHWFIQKYAMRTSSRSGWSGTPSATSTATPGLTS